MCTLIRSVFDNVASPASGAVVKSRLLVTAARKFGNAACAYLLLIMFSKIAAARTKRRYVLCPSGISPVNMLIPTRDFPLLRH
jgi:hypothetical protein